MKNSQLVVSWSPLVETANFYCRQGLYGICYILLHNYVVKIFLGNLCRRFISNII